MNDEKRNAEKPIKTHKCYICETEYCDNIKLEIHINQVHNNLGKSKCDICGQYFASPYISNHIEAVHKNTKSLQCDICEQMFSISVDLNKHISMGLFQ